MRFSALTAAALLVCSQACSSVWATTVKELVRIKGQGESVLQGYGLVTGLAGTGDSGKELAMARPLAEVLKSQGNALGTPKDLANSKSVALVIVTCTVPAAGVRADDTLDVSVSVVNSASSLKGGSCSSRRSRGPSRTPNRRSGRWRRGWWTCRTPLFPRWAK